MRYAQQLLPRVGSYCLVVLVVAGAGAGCSRPKPAGQPDPAPADGGPALAPVNPTPDGPVNTPSGPDDERAGLPVPAPADGEPAPVPGSPDYKPKYFGDLRSRDAAYHQGTVWAWLIGPFVDAWLRAHPDDRAGAAALLNGFRRHMGEACVGSISEIFDAQPPYTPRGCIAQAWSVAEVLRSLVKTAG